ncbi:MAG: SRPBCC family protein [Actinomycetota bacterium]
MSDAPPPEGVVSAVSSAEGITIVRIFDAPRELVFKAWIEPERFTTWFGEHGSSMPVDTVSMDVRPGGAWSATMFHGPDRIEIPFSGEYREVDEPERLVLTLVDPEDPENGDVEVMTVVLEDIGEGKTQMTFTQTGNLPADEYSRAMRGSLIFFDRLNDHLKSRHDT